MKEEVKLYKRKGGWAKIVQFLDKEGIHKFSAQAIQLGDPSFILKHIRITEDDNKIVHCFPVVIRDINKVDRNSIRKIYNDKSGVLELNLLSYINRRKKVLDKQVPILTTEEIDYAVRSKKNRYSVEFLDSDNKLVRASLATIEVYNKKYFLFAIQKKVGNKYTVEDPATLLKNYKLVDIRVGIMNAFYNLFRIRNGMILPKPRAFYTFENDTIANMSDVLLNMAMVDIKNNNKLKPSVKLRKISDYGFKVPVIIIG